MKKPNSLRDHLLSAIRELNRDPDRMLIFVDEGKIRCTMSSGLSFEYEYKLNLLLTDYAGELDAVMIPLFDWIRTNQPELMANLDKNKDSFKFEAVLQNNDAVDLELSIPLTERVIVKRLDDGTLDIKFPDEPQYTRAEAAQPYRLLDKQGNVMAEWVSAEPGEQYF